MRKEFSLSLIQSQVSICVDRSGFQPWFSLCVWTQGDALGCDDGAPLAL